MRQVLVRPQNAHQAALGTLGRLTDRLRHLAGLTVTETNAAFLIADDDERGEAEPAAALHHLGYPVDVDELVDKLVVALFPVPMFTCHFSFQSNQKLRPPSRAASASAFTRPW